MGRGQILKVLHDIEMNGGLFSVQRKPPTGFQRGWHDRIHIFKRSLYVNEFLQPPHLIPLNWLDYQRFTKEEMYHTGYKSAGPGLTHTTLSPGAGLCLPLMGPESVRILLLEHSSCPTKHGRALTLSLRSLRRSMKYSINQSTMSIFLSYCWQH